MPNTELNYLDQIEIDVDSDVMMSEDSIMETGVPNRDISTSDNKYQGLHLRVGVVYAIDKENLTALIGDADARSGERLNVKDTGTDVYTGKAMILTRNVGLETNPLEVVDRFGCDIVFPAIGTHVVYANLYGENGNVENRVILGSIFPLNFDYNATEVFLKIKETFSILDARKLYKSPTGYYNAEAENGDIFEGFFDLTVPSVPKKVWEKTQLKDGSYKKIIYDVATGLQEMVKITIDSLGNYKLETKIGAKFGPNAAGLIQFENSTASLKTILTEMQEVLVNLIDGVLNWQGNLGAPLIYKPQVTDTVKLVGVLTKINTLLG
jgi:hypothetical protein